MSSRALVNYEQAVKIHDAAATLPAPTSATVAASLDFAPGAGKPREAQLRVIGSDASVDMTGGSWVTGKHRGDGLWYKAGQLDEGADINVGDGVNAPGRIWPLTDILAWASAIQLQAGAVAGGTITAYVEYLDNEGPE
jgi:hypothetical protein